MNFGFEKEYNLYQTCVFNVFQSIVVDLKLSGVFRRKTYVQLTTQSILMWAAARIKIFRNHCRARVSEGVKGIVVNNKQQAYNLVKLYRKEKMVGV